MSYAAAGGLGICPNWRLGSSCKARSCRVCGVRWARDWWKCMETNLSAAGDSLLVVSLTPPGAERLPWDIDHCSRRRPHECSGPKGCRVQQRAAREWNDTAAWRWQKLREAARNATRRQLGLDASGEKVVIWERVWEPQKRGVIHGHVVLPYGTEREREIANVFCVELCRRVRSYDFGWIQPSPRLRHLKRAGLVAPDARVTQQQLMQLVEGATNEQALTLAGLLEVTPKTGREAARYLASYLTGRNPRKKTSIRENVAMVIEIPTAYGTIKHPVMPRSLIWVSPALTKRTNTTMRTLRRARHQYAAARGICPPPVWKSMREAAQVAIVARRNFARRSARAEPLDEDGLFRFADQLQQELGPCWKHKLYEEPSSFTYERQPTPLGKEINDYWISLAGLAEAA